MDIEQIIADAKRTASETISVAFEIRREFEEGHPNSSSHATSEGAIRAMAVWMSAETEAVTV